MARIKYYYDTETCKYERVKVKPSDVAINILGFVSVAFLCSLALMPLYNSYFRSDREEALQRENQELKLYYEVMNKELQKTTQMLSALRERDDNIYRVIFEASPIPESVREAGVGGVDRYKEILEKGLKNEELILSTRQKIDKLKKKMYIQTKSYDEIVTLVNNKTKMLASLPAIQPVSNKELKRLASGFGMRMHPIYKVMKMHTGVDFACQRGTPIYATGDGVISVAVHNSGGYGNEVQVSHGYGYTTLYAHMERFIVHTGQRVKRGQLIGYVGSTGTSVSPHLHYEVLHNGQKVNPIHFFYNDLTPMEYQKLLELASVENQSLS
ncbi:peptidoglycan DD-metalloendopeptidase family protein [Cytophagaceae bacterium YF14B1]|uniref:Peptidoglycan DD-metalloendopeptidase family protein n=1 Tax=Xanthocytophaga flava TaxID=3048013 RepID=A0AAE3UBW2_9BACT|nr:peptidoglycan DD-metalloendopeptidase family protein [Xanthocytophaga flavus]MDJ1484159.1 peptidoglycan DD-metalloendopeptidase family protein [Xanthocytophaga flavus]